MQRQQQCSSSSNSLILLCRAKETPAVLTMTAVTDFKMTRRFEKRQSFCENVKNQNKYRYVREQMKNIDFPTRFYQSVPEQETLVGKQKFSFGRKH